MERTSTTLRDASNPIDIVPVFNWDAAAYGGASPACNAFFMEVTDQRKDHGRMFVDVAAESGNLDDVMIVSLEINRLPGSKTAVQCLHVAFDTNNMAFSLFKQGDRYILRPENGVGLSPTILTDGTHAFIVEMD